MGATTTIVQAGLRWAEWPPEVPEGLSTARLSSGGYDWHCGQLTLGPIAALQYTYASIDSFSEHGSLAPLNIHTQSAESLRTDIGLIAFYIWQIGKVLVEPNLRAAWEHEAALQEGSVAQFARGCGTGVSPVITQIPQIQ